MASRYFAAHRAAGERKKIEESQHPLQDAAFFYGLSRGLKIARQLSIFTPVCPLVPPFRVPSFHKN